MKLSDLTAKIDELTGAYGDLDVFILQRKCLCVDEEILHQTEELLRLDIGKQLDMNGKPYGLRVAMIEGE